MNKLIAAFALVSAAVAGPALADVGISIRVGEPGFYGQLDIGDFRPRRVRANARQDDHMVLANEPAVPP